MNWGSMAEFLAMGGYAGYVWGSFGVTAVIFVAEILLLARRSLTARHQLPSIAEEDRRN